MQVKQRHASAGPSGIESRRTKVRREVYSPSSPDVMSMQLYIGSIFLFLY